MGELVSPMWWRDEGEIPSFPHDPYHLWYADQALESREKESFSCPSVAAAPWKAESVPLLNSTVQLTPVTGSLVSCFCNLSAI